MALYIREDVLVTGIENVLSFQRDDDYGIGLILTTGVTVFGQINSGVFSYRKVTTKQKLQQYSLGIHSDPIISGCHHCHLDKNDTFTYKVWTKPFQIAGLGIKILIEPEDDHRTILISNEAFWIYCHGDSLARYKLTSSLPDPRRIKKAVKYYFLMDDGVLYKWSIHGRDDIMTSKLVPLELKVVHLDRDCALLEDGSVYPLIVK